MEIREKKLRSAFQHPPILLLILLYLPSMPNRQHQHHDPFLLDPADNPVIPHAVAPKSRQVGRQGFAKMPGILAILDPVVQIVENSLPYRFVETIQLMYGIRRKLNPPGQGRASLPHAIAFCRRQVTSLVFFTI